MKHYFESVETVLEHMGSSKNGIDPKEASLRLENMAATSWTKARKRPSLADF